MKFIPHDYQKYVIEYIKSNSIAAILLDMGLGWQNNHFPDRHRRLVV